MKQIVKAASLFLLVSVLLNVTLAQFGPPVNWDKNIIKRDANMKICRQWATSFESWEDFNGFQITPVNDGKGSAHTLTSARVRSGKMAHMGMITGVQDDMHTGYPSVQLFKDPKSLGGFSGGIYIEVWIWMDIAISYGQWVTLGRISPSTDDTPGTRYISLDIGDQGYLQLGNVPDPSYYFHVYQNFNNMFPRRQWVNVTMFVNFDPNNGYSALWQDNVLQSVAQVNGGYYRLNQLHFGLFAQNLIPGGVIYNDDLTIQEVTTMDQPCPANAYVMTLPPTNAPAPTQGADSDYMQWVSYVENAGEITRLSFGLAMVCLLLAFLIL
jgi:hypothetical protein